MQGKELFSGGHGGRGTPGPMSNPEVKPASADGTVWGTHGRVGRCQKTDLKAEETDTRQLPPPFFMPTNCPPARGAAP